MGAYINVANYELSGDRYGEYVSVRVCHSKLSEAGRSRTYRHQYVKMDGAVWADQHRLLPYEDSETWTDAECAAHM